MSQTIKNKKEWALSFIENCKNGDLENVKNLMKEAYVERDWVDLEAKGKEGMNGVHWAARYGHLDLVKYLLTSDEVPNRKKQDIHDGNDFLLMIALWNEEGEILKFLLNPSMDWERHGQQPYSRDVWRVSGALEEACKKSLDMVRWILEDQWRPEWKGLGELEMNRALAMACRYGQLDTIKYLLTSQELKKMGHALADANQGGQRALLEACEHGHLEVVKYLLNDEELTGIQKNVSWGKSNGRNGKERSSDALMKAMTFGRLDVVQYLLVNPMTLEKEVELGGGENLKFKEEIKDAMQKGFVLACKMGQMGVISWLLTSRELMKARGLVDPAQNDHEGLRKGLEWGKLEVGKYLLTSKELKDNGVPWGDVHAQNNEIFRGLATRMYSQEILKWLIVDYGLEKTMNIERIMKERPSEEVEEYFRIQEEKKELEKSVGLGKCEESDQEKIKRVVSNKKAKKL